MKAELETGDIEAIAQRVVELLRPLLSSNGKHEAEDTILDVRGLAEYLTVSQKWIYERTQFKEIPFKKIKGLLRFRKRDIDKWLDSYNVPTVNTSQRTLKAIK
jgi:excisionase family DNA binding protein